MINRMMIHGRLTKDIEVTQAGGFSKTEFTVAWSEKYKDIEKKCFLRCVAWRSTAEFLQKYFKKGQEIMVEGQMVTDEWEKDGQKQSRTLCNIEKVHFCGSKSSGSEIPDTKNTDFVNVPDTDQEELLFS